MPQSHGSQYKKKPTGGTKRAWRGKRAYETGSEPTETTLGPAKKRWVETRGGGLKVRLAAADSADVTDKASGKSSKSKLLRVIRNPPQQDYPRRGVSTKGAIGETELGHARVTCWPGQGGVM